MPSRVHPLSPEYVPGLAHAAWTTALGAPGGFGLAFQEPPPGTVSAPGYVGASINEHGQPYLHVLDEQKAAIGMALNNYEVTSERQAPSGNPPAVVTIEAKRSGSPPGNLVAILMHDRQDRAIAIVGDPLVDPQISVLFGRSLPALSELAGGRTWYVLDDPPSGWAAEPTVDEQRILTILEQIGKGWRLGAIVGGLLGLGIVVAASRRARSSSP